jgi:hypothetical protein
MGLTKRCDFTTPLLKALEDRGYRRTAEPSTWIPAATRRDWHVRGEALACRGDDADEPPCLYKSFGDYRFDRLRGDGGDQVVVVSYYWHLDLWRAQYPFLHDDFQQDPGFISGPLKHETVGGGLGDAAAYLGDLGIPLREGMATAICAMLQDAADLQSRGSSGLETCLAEGEGSRIAPKVQFGFVSHSLGSRILFDVLTDGWGVAGPAERRRASQREAYETLAAQTTSFFMAANQLPLLGPGLVSVTAQPPIPPTALPEHCANLPSFLALRCVLKSSGDQRLVRDSMLDVVAFHDPGDLLGYRVSGGMAAAPSGVRFLTVEHRNTPQILWAGSWPLSAHDRELERQTSIGLILCGGVEARGTLRPRVCGSGGR